MSRGNEGPVPWTKDEMATGLSKFADWLAGALDGLRAPGVDSFLGCLGGVAVGNSLGIPFEGAPKEMLNDIPDDDLINIDPTEAWAPWDDDLAQTVILADELLARDHLELDALSKRFVSWARENGRGMGNLTYRVISKLAEGVSADDAARVVWEEDGRGPAGNGAVMRCAPLSLRWWGDPHTLVNETFKSCVVTHWDQRCIWSTVVTTSALTAVLRESTLKPSELADALEGAGAHAEVANAVRGLPSDLAGLELDEPSSSGYTVRAMNLTLWCAVAEGDFEILRPEFENLFTDRELQLARDRRKLAGYEPVD